MNETPSAAALLREARTKAGLPQVELARRAGVAQSVVSVYESGRRQPAFPMLVRLIEATGHAIDVILRPHVVQQNQAHGPLASKVHAHRAELRRAAAKYGASNLRLFGSVARSEETAESDVDLLADFSTGTSLFTLAKLQRELEAILGAPVDIVPATDLKQHVRAEVERDLVLL